LKPLKFNKYQAKTKCTHYLLIDVIILATNRAVVCDQLIDQFFFDFFALNDFLLDGNLVVLLTLALILTFVGLTDITGA